MLFLNSIKKEYLNALQHEEVHSRKLPTLKKTPLTTKCICLGPFHYRMQCLRTNSLSFLINDSVIACAHHVILQQTNAGKPFCDTNASKCYCMPSMCTHSNSVCWVSAFREFTAILFDKPRDKLERHPKHFASLLLSSSKTFCGTSSKCLRRNGTHVFRQIQSLLQEDKMLFADNKPLEKCNEKGIFSKTVLFDEDRGLWSILHLSNGSPYAFIQNACPHTMPTVPTA